MRPFRQLSQIEQASVFKVLAKSLAGKKPVAAARPVRVSNASTTPFHLTPAASFHFRPPKSARFDKFLLGLQARSASTFVAVDKFLQLFNQQSTAPSPSGISPAAFYSMNDRDEIFKHLTAITNTFFPVDAPGDLKNAIYLTYELKEAFKQNNQAQFFQFVAFQKIFSQLGFDFTSGQMLLKSNFSLKDCVLLHTPNGRSCLAQMIRSMNLMGNGHIAYAASLQLLAIAKRYKIPAIKMVDIALARQNDFWKERDNYSDEEKAQTLVKNMSFVMPQSGIFDISKFKHSRSCFAPTGNHFADFLLGHNTNINTKGLRALLNQTDFSSLLSNDSKDLLSLFPTETSNSTINTMPIADQDSKRCFRTNPLLRIIHRKIASYLLAEYYLDCNKKEVDISDKVTCVDALPWLQIDKNTQVLTKKNKQTLNVLLRVIKSLYLHENQELASNLRNKIISLLKYHYLGNDEAELIAAFEQIMPMDEHKNELSPGSIGVDAQGILHSPAHIRVKMQAIRLANTEVLVSPGDHSMSAVAKTHINEQKKSQIIERDRVLMEGVFVDQQSDSSIMDQAGRVELSAEIKANYPDGLASNEIAVTESYRLKKQGIQQIFHIVEPRGSYQEYAEIADEKARGKKARKQIEQCYVNILNKCKQMGVISVAIPVLSSRETDLGLGASTSSKIALEVCSRPEYQGLQIDLYGMHRDMHTKFLSYWKTGNHFTPAYLRSLAIQASAHKTSKTKQMLPSLSHMKPVLGSELDQDFLSQDSNTLSALICPSDENIQGHSHFEQGVIAQLAKSINSKYISEDIKDKMLEANKELEMQLKAKAAFDIVKSFLPKVLKTSVAATINDSNFNKQFWAASLPILTFSAAPNQSSPIFQGKSLEEKRKLASQLLTEFYTQAYRSFMQSTSRAESISYEVSIPLLRLNELGLSDEEACKIALQTLSQPEFSQYSIHLHVPKELIPCFKACYMPMKKRLDALHQKNKNLGIILNNFESAEDARQKIC